MKNNKIGASIPNQTAQYILFKQAIIDLSMIYKPHGEMLFSLSELERFHGHLSYISASIKDDSHKRNENRDERNTCWDTVRIRMELHD